MPRRFPPVTAVQDAPDFAQGGAMRAVLRSPLPGHQAP